MWKSARRRAQKVEEARPKLQKESLEQFLEGNRSRGGMQMGELNNNLHSYWIKLSGNRYIIDFFERQALYYTTLFDYAAPERTWSRKWRLSTGRFSKRRRRARWSDAKKALVRHIRDQKPIVQQLMEQVQGGAAEAKPDQVSSGVSGVEEAAERGENAALDSTPLLLFSERFVIRLSILAIRSRSPLRSKAIASTSYEIGAR